MVIIMQLPRHIKDITARLEERGFEAYAVGGCVRDSLLGLTPPDYDIATSAAPDEIKAAFIGLKTVDIGAKHGTIALITEHGKVEVTSFRSDGDYSDSRRPDSVTFTRDLKSDLSRRDFTINAMAYSEKAGLIDIFGGEQDLKFGVLKCVGEPEKRFTEDALRIMRALRFMSEHRFTPEADTDKALRNLCGRLLLIAPERISAELDRLLQGRNAERVILDYHEVLSVFIPELAACAGFEQHTKYHIYDVLTHTTKVVAHVPKVRVLLLAALFHDIAKPMCYTFEDNKGHFHGHAAESAQIAEIIMHRMRYDNAAIQRVKLLVKHHDDDSHTDDVNVKRALNKFGLEALEQLCALKIADDSSKADFVKAEIAGHELLIKQARELAESGGCYSLPQLAVKGSDLIEQGLQGEQVGKTLQKLLDLVIEGKTANNKAELLRMV